MFWYSLLAVGLRVPALEIRLDLVSILIYFTVGLFLFAGGVLLYVLLRPRSKKPSLPAGRTRATDTRSGSAPKRRHEQR